MNLSRDVPGAGVIFRDIHLSIIMPASMKTDQSFTKNKNRLSGQKNSCFPKKAQSLKKKETGTPPTLYLLHRNRVIYIPDAGKGDRCDRRVDIVERICLDLFW